MDARLRRFLQSFEHVVFAGIVLIGTNTLINEGYAILFRDITRSLRGLPGFNVLLKYILQNEVKSAIKTLAPSSSSTTGTSSDAENALIPIPEIGLHPSQILEILDDLKLNETAAEKGKAFAYTYTTNSSMSEFSKTISAAYDRYSESSGSHREDMDHLLSAVWDRFMHSNALNPTMYPSLRQFENEIISMSAWMVHGDSNTAGSLTSGGTESILMAVKAYRDRARKLMPHIKKPNMIVSITIHPAFEKAAHYFDVEIIHVKTTPDYRVDVNAVAKKIDSNTILLVGSAPQYCHAVIDPMEALAELAIKHGLPLHVDACFGGFMLPWLEKIGCEIPPWDFRVNGVTSISADIHKYGYSSKGASVILYKNSELRYYQYFAYSEWPGGLFGSPSMAGSRPGGMIAAAWAAMVAMGQNGYMAIAKQVLDTTKKLLAGVEGIEGIKVLTKPDMTALAIVSEDPSKLSIIAVADAMKKIGDYKMEIQQYPTSLHMSIMPQHAAVVDDLLKHLKEAVELVKQNPNLNHEGSTGMYGMTAAIPDKGIVDEFILGFFGEMYTHKGAGIVESYLAKQHVENTST